jgi:hypothetical protein
MWNQLTSELLRTSLSASERSTLDKVALDPEQQNVLAEIATNIASEWRGGLRSVCVIDSRAGYVPDELLIHILADFRYRAFTRLPGMKGLLDDLRVKEWDRAMKVRDNLKSITVVLPDADHLEAAEQSGSATELASGEGAYPTSGQMDGLM